MAVMNPNPERRVIIKGILSIYGRLLEGYCDMELQATLIRAWRLQATTPGQTEPMDTIDIGFIGSN